MWWNRLSLLILVLTSGCRERAEETPVASRAPHSEDAAPAEPQSKPQPEVKPAAKTEPLKPPPLEPAAKKEPRIPITLDPAVRKLAATLLEADEVERDKAAKTLVAMKRAAIPYLLEVFLDDANAPRKEVFKVLSDVWTVRGIFQDSFHPEATEILLDALTYPNPTIRRAAANGLYIGVYDPKDTVRTIQALRNISVSDLDASVRKQAAMVLQFIATDLVNVMTEPFADPRNDDKHFATIVLIGENALGPLKQGMTFVDSALQDAADLERIRRGIGARDMDPLVRQRLLRLMQWREESQRTIGVIRNDPKFGK